MTTVARVTGATRNLGLALAQALADRLRSGDTVYLTGRDRSRVEKAVAVMVRGEAEVRGEVLDFEEDGPGQPLRQVLPWHA